MLYHLSRATWRFIEWNCIRDVVLHRDKLPTNGPFILAVSHLSHLEPAMVSARVRQKVRWMARAEYYRYWIGRFLLDRLDCIRVKRGGVPISAIRTAISALRGGEVIGIFPEGGVKVGSDSVLRGGALKGGAALLSIRSGAPIIPVVVLGTDKLTRIGPWLPWRRGRVYLSFGEPLQPPSEVVTTRRVARIELTALLARQFEQRFAELLQESGLRDEDVP